MTPNKVSTAPSRPINLFALAAAAPLLGALASSTTALAEDTAAILSSSELASLHFEQDTEATLNAGAKPEDPSASGGDADLAKKLNNPVADLISVPLQFNYNEPYGPKNASNVTLNIQPVIPFNLMLGQVTTIGDQSVQFRVGGRWYADAPDDGPEWGLRFEIVFLFPK